MTPAEETVHGAGRADGLVVVCTYRVRSGRSTEFERLLAQHAPTLRRLGLITDSPPYALRRTDGAEPEYIEVFEWASAEAAARAAEVPDVLAIWEPMAALCESRDAHPGMSFPLFDRLGHHR